MADEYDVFTRLPVLQMFAHSNVFIRMSSCPLSKALPSNSNLPPSFTKSVRTLCAYWLRFQSWFHMHFYLSPILVCSVSLAQYSRRYVGGFMHKRASVLRDHFRRSFCPCVIWSCAQSTNWQGNFDHKYTKWALFTRGRSFHLKQSSFQLSIFQLPCTVFFAKGVHSYRVLDWQISS